MYLFIDLGTSIKCIPAERKSSNSVVILLTPCADAIPDACRYAALDLATKWSSDAVKLLEVVEKSKLTDGIAEPVNHDTQK